ncbi:MAG: RdgB/HAM1 family non-canonical purine NTP pyrophosphatase [Caulobacterales bacterium]|jgi:XTP/dITP diphosphohydrolase
MKPPPRLVIASHNAGKVKEIGDLLGPLNIAVLSAASLNLAEPEETEPTFLGNAALKAHAAALASGLPALADDSGLEVLALAGAPGVVSARWAGPTKDFNIAMQRVWAEFFAQKDADPAARFVCVLALAQPNGDVATFEGEVKGKIVWPMRGNRGFGYDPIFMPEGYTITFGEMEPHQKHLISHRAAAFAKLVQFWS